MQPFLLTSDVFFSINYSLKQPLMSRKSKTLLVATMTSFDDFSDYLVLFVCLIKIWLAGFVLFLIYALHVINSLQRIRWNLRQKIAPIIKLTCNFRYLNVEGNHRVINALLGVFFIYKLLASVYRQAIKLTSYILETLIWTTKKAKNIGDWSQ